MGIEELIKELGNINTRERAVWALGVLEEKRATEELCRMLDGESDLKLRFTIAKALRRINDPRARDALTRFTDYLVDRLEQEDDFDWKLVIVHELGDSLDPALEDMFIDLVTTKLEPVWIKEEIGGYDGSCHLKAAAIRSLGKVGSTKALMLMQYGLYHKLYPVQDASVDALANIVRLYPENREQILQIAEVLLNKLLELPPESFEGRRAIESGFEIVPTVSEQDKKRYDFNVPGSLPTVLAQIVKDHPEETELARDLVKVLIWRARDGKTVGVGYSHQLENSIVKALVDLGEIARPHLIDAVVDNENYRISVGASLVLRHALIDNLDDEDMRREILPVMVYSVRFEGETAYCMHSMMDCLAKECLQKCETSQEIEEFRSSLDRGRDLLEEKGGYGDRTRMFVAKWKRNATKLKKKLQEKMDAGPVLEGTIRPKASQNKTRRTVKGR